MPKMLLFTSFAPAVLLLMLLFAPCTAKNMNGAPGNYVITNEFPAPSTSNNLYSTEYTAEYFDVYSPPIRSLYSQVYWTSMPDLKLPDHIVKRFANKTMAIVGYEADQVRRIPGKEDISVPITHAYNHHYMAWLRNSKKARIMRREATQDEIRAGLAYHGHMYQTEYLDDGGRNKSATDIPAAQVFSEANGGEFRMSHHGYPKRYAQLLHGPDSFQIYPMQIDTWNRDAKESPKFFPGGPLPKSSRIPDSAGYSGLIECPCSDRLTRETHMTYQLTTGVKSCKQPVRNATECWVAAQQMVAASDIRRHIYHQNNFTEKQRMSGCSLEQHANGSMDIYWNEKQGETYMFHQEEDSEAASEIVAFASAQINVSVALSGQLATITLVGPADRWFGIGFGTDSMCLHMEADECPSGGPYSIIVVGDDVSERKLDHHGPGIKLDQSVTVVSNTVTGENRTVILTRPLVGRSDKYYTFDPKMKQSKIPIIMARGCNLVFSQHCGHGPSLLNFVAMDTPTRICQTGVQGMIDGTIFTTDRCPGPPASDLLAQRNPTCFFETYRGGLSCCRHLKFLLDQDQQVPWRGQILEYHLKFRFYFEEYEPAVPSHNDSAAVTPASHKNLNRLYHQTEFAAGEYDIVQCPEGTPPSQCIHTITAQWKVDSMVKNDGWESDIDYSTVDGVELIYAGPHCHAPSCISMELYHVETGQLLCRMTPVFGDKDETVMEERNFLALPPCLWGSEDNLADPVYLPMNGTLLSIKKNNNTLPHTGEMASWQMRGYLSMKAGHKIEDEQVSNEDEDSTYKGNEEGTVGEEKFETQTRTAIRHRRREDV